MKNRFLFKCYQLLGRLARRYLLKRQPLIIGINGSVGKTSCRMIIDDILQANLGDQLTIYTSPKNFNGELGMSLSIFKIQERTPSVSGMISVLKIIMRAMKSSAPRPYDILILEYGIDRPLEMEFLCSIARPHISVLTKLDAVHSLQFGDAEAIAHEELKLQTNTLLKCYINTDDQYGMTLALSLQTKVAYYNTNNLRTRNQELGTIFASDYTIYHNTHTEPSLTAPICSQSTLYFGQTELLFTTDSVGQIHHNYVALAYDIADSVRKQYNLPTITRQTTTSLHLQPGRMSIFEGIHNSVIMDSTYNSSPLSVRKIIEESLLIHKTLFPDRPILYLLGEMRELGDSKVQHHLELADYLMTRLQPHDQVILLGQAMTHTFEKILGTGNQELGTIYHYLDFHDVITKSQEILGTINQKLETPLFIIAKGSQNTIFLEEVVKSLLAYPEESYKLTRQTPFWDKKKQNLTN